jgi:hypothetical protein
MLLEIAALSFVLAASPQRREAGEHLCSATSGGGNIIIVGGTQESSSVWSASLETALADDLALVPDVQSVFVERAQRNLLVWIGVDNPTREVREKVFQKQFDIIDGFPEISFDFNLVAGKNRDAREFASEAKLIYSRQG